MAFVNGCLQQFLRGSDHTKTVHGPAQLCPVTLDRSYRRFIVFALPGEARKICGWVTQFGTISGLAWSHIASAPLCRTSGHLASGALRYGANRRNVSVRVEGYTTAGSIPKLATHSSLCLLSTNTPEGFSRPVRFP